MNNSFKTLFEANSIAEKLGCSIIPLIEDSEQRFDKGTAHFKKCKQLFEYQHLRLLRDIWWTKF